MYLGNPIEGKIKPGLSRRQVGGKTSGAYSVSAVVLGRGGGSTKMVWVGRKRQRWQRQGTRNFAEKTQKMVQLRATVVLIGTVESVIENENAA